MDGWVQRASSKRSLRSLKWRFSLFFRYKQPLIFILILWILHLFALIPLLRQKRRRLHHLTRIWHLKRGTWALPQRILLWIPWTPWQINILLLRLIGILLLSRLFKSCRLLHFVGILPQKQLVKMTILRSILFSNTFLKSLKLSMNSIGLLFLFLNVILELFAGL
jgi:hypothetical protein